METVREVVNAWVTGEISLDEAAEYITDRWEWPHRTHAMMNAEEDLVDPEFGAVNVMLQQHGGPLSDDRAKYQEFSTAVFDRVDELMEAGIIPPRPGYGD